VGAGTSGRILVTVDQHDEVMRREYDLVVNCTGSSPLRQLTGLLDGTSTNSVESRLGVALSDERALARELDVSLALRGLWPRLHVPALAGLAQGPGFANLSSLGLLSDRVLGGYADADHPTPPSARPATAAVAPGLGL
jgi:mycobactin lysine-N-oxygenase